MKEIVEKINISKVIWVYMLSSLLLLSIVSYIGIILSTAITVANSNDLQRQIVSVGLEIGELEGNSLKSDKKVDLQLASQLGFHYVKNPEFIDSSSYVALVN